MYLNQLLWVLNFFWGLGWSSGWHTVRERDSVSSKMMLSGPFWILSIMESRSMTTPHWVLIQQRWKLFDGWFIFDVSVLRKHSHLFYVYCYSLPLMFVAQPLSLASWCQTYCLLDKLGMMFDCPSLILQHIQHFYKRFYACKHIQGAVLTTEMSYFLTLT